MKKINGILLIFFILTGCAATSYEGQQTRGNGLDMKYMEKIKQLQKLIKQERQHQILLEL